MAEEDTLPTGTSHEEGVKAAPSDNGACNSQRSVQEAGNVEEPIKVRPCPRPEMRY